MPTLIKAFSSSEQDTQLHPQTVSSKRQLLLLQVLCFPSVFLEDALYTMVMGNMGQEPFSKRHKQHQHWEIYFSTLYLLSFQNCILWGKKNNLASHILSCAFSASQAKWNLGVTRKIVIQFILFQNYLHFSGESENFTTLRPHSWQDLVYTHKNS